jgi:hypothetical protein
MAALTDAILKLPHQPTRIAQLGLFRSRGISTLSVIVEEKDGQLSLIPAGPRGAPTTTIGRNSRTARSFVVPHLARESTVYADEVQGVRVMGSENEAEAVQTVVNDRLVDLRKMHDVTLEYHRIGALKGQILDADGTTVIYNLFTEFGVSQQTKDFAFSSGSTDVRQKAVEAARLVEGELGGQPYTRLRAFCSSGFFDALVGHANVKTAFQYQEGRAILAGDLRYVGFEFGGIIWEEYRGSVTGSDGNAKAFIPTNEAILFPEGPDIYTTYFAPADFVETVNTIGLPLYAKTFIDPELQRYARIHTQSNPLAMCLRPRAVIRLTQS